MLASLFPAPRAAATAATAPVELLYSERPPYMYRDGRGVVVGLTAEPAFRAFERAGIPYVLHEASPAQRLKALQANATRVCSLGFYATDERLSYALLTNAVSQDAAMVAVVNKDVPVDGIRKISDLLVDPKLRILTKSNIDYGPYLEDRFAHMRAERVETSSEYGQLVRLIHHKRAHVLFLPAEEAGYYLQASGYADTEFRILKFSDMPSGQRRYIMCSRQVGAEAVEKLNQAIRQTPHP